MKNKKFMCMIMLTIMFSANMNTLVSNAASMRLQANITSSAPVLSGINTSLGTPTAQTNGDTKSYVLSAYSNQTNIKINVTTTNPKDIVLIANNITPQGKYSTDISLKPGENWIEIVLLSSDGTKKSSYHLLVGKLASKDTGLKSIVWGTDGRGAVKLNNLTYMIDLPVGISSLDLRIIANSTEAQTLFNGSVINGQNTIHIEPQPGDNNFNIKVTAGNGDEKTYVLRVVCKEPSSEASLKSLQVSYGGKLATTPSNGDYDIEADYLKSGFRITATAMDPYATLTINGVAVPNGKESGTIYTTLGQTRSVLRVTAQDGTTYKEYVVIINKSKGNAPLSSHKFTDINGYQYKSSIDLLSARNIISGVTDKLYKPEMSITKEQFCIMIARAFDLKESTEFKGKLDMSKSSPYYNYVLACFDAGVFSALQASDFNLKSTITREDALVSLAFMYNKVTSLPDVKAQDVQSTLGVFSDRESIDKRKARSIAVLVNVGLAQNIFEAQLQPKKALTRGEAVALLAKMLQTLYLV